MGQARELMDRATESIVTGNLEALRDIYAADVVATTPDAGTLHGIDQFIEWNRAFVDAFSDLELNLTQAFETVDCAIDQGEMLGTHTGPLQQPDGQSLPATGKQVRIRAMDVAKVQDGKIIRHDFYFDQLDFLDQLGLMEALVSPKPA